MIVVCPKCSNQSVSVTAEGKYEPHYPPPKKVGYDPVNVHFCELSGNEPANLEALKGACLRCGLLLVPNDDGATPQHYPNPARTSSPEGFCGEGIGQGRGAVRQFVRPVPDYRV